MDWLRIVLKKIMSSYLWQVKLWMENVENAAYVSYVTSELGSLFRLQTVTINSATFGVAISGICHYDTLFNDEWLDLYFKEKMMCELLCRNCHRKYDTNVARKYDVDQRLARLAQLVALLARLDAQRA